MELKSISPSRLNVWLTCQYQYRLRYHDKLKTDVVSPAAEFGSYIHKVLEHMVRDGISEKECLRKFISDYQFSPDYLKRIPVIMSNFRKVNDLLPESLVETDFSIPSDAYPAPLNGVIDRMIPMGDSVVIMDYKTGVREKSRNEAHKDPQMLLYAYASQAITALPYRSISLCLFYLLSGNMIRVRFQGPEVLKFVTYVGNVSRTILSTEPEQAKASPSYLCRFCDYRERCDPCRKFQALRKSR